MIGNDRIFDALVDVQRRRLLVRLLDTERYHVLPLSGASREMAQANDAFLEEYLTATRKLPEVDEDRLRLHHVHLPKLADFGFVEWQPEDHVVTKGPQFDEIAPLLEFLDAQRTDDPVTASDALFR